MNSLMNLRKFKEEIIPVLYNCNQDTESEGTLANSLNEASETSNTKTRQTSQERKTTNISFMNIYVKSLNNISKLNPQRTI